MKDVHIYIGILAIGILVGCSVKPDRLRNIVNTSTKSSNSEFANGSHLILTKTIIANNDTLRIKIEKDSLSNLYIKVFDVKGHVLGSAAVMFSDIQDTLNPAKAFFLSKNTIPSYVIQTYDKGSTYGAQSLIIIWFDGSIWRVTRDVFERAIIKDENDDGIYEIVDYANSEKGIIYHFQNGGFCRATSTSTPSPRSGAR